MLDEYFGGSARAYRDHDPHKLDSFNQFVRTCQRELASLPMLRRNCAVDPSPFWGKWVRSVQASCG
jgi:hypothetical protein